MIIKTIQTLVLSIILVKLLVLPLWGFMILGYNTDPTQVLGSSTQSKNVTMIYQRDVNIVLKDSENQVFEDVLPDNYLDAKYKILIDDVDALPKGVKVVAVREDKLNLYVQNVNPENVGKELSVRLNVYQLD